MERLFHELINFLGVGMLETALDALNNRRAQYTCSTGPGRRCLMAEFNLPALLNI
jgi:hypothetical protein